VVHAGRDALRQHPRLGVVVDALDLDVFEVGPVRRLITETMRQIIELEPHAVVVVVLERHAADLFRHGNSSLYPHHGTFVLQVGATAKSSARARNARARRHAAAAARCCSSARRVASSRSAIRLSCARKRCAGTGTEIAIALPARSRVTTPAAQIPSVCSSRSKATPTRRADLSSLSRSSSRVIVFAVRLSKLVPISRATATSSSPAR